MAQQATLEAGKKQDPESLQRVRTEMVEMIADLNEVRMRLDAMVRKLAGDGDCAEKPCATGDSIEALQMTLDRQLDRIRQKLIARIPDST